MKVIETVIFTPYTQDFRLKDNLQKAEESITAELQLPSARFIERGGKRVSNVLERNYPWKRKAQFPRSRCPLCCKAGS